MGCEASRSNIQQLKANLLIVIYLIENSQQTMASNKQQNILILLSIYMYLHLKLTIFKLDKQNYISAFLFQSIL